MIDVAKDRALQPAERLRTCESLDCGKIMLEYVAAQTTFYVRTFTVNLFKSDKLYDAVLFLEVMQLVECDISISLLDIARAIKKEIKQITWKRLPRLHHGKIIHLVTGVEKRLSGLSPETVGNKSTSKDINVII